MSPPQHIPFVYRLTFLYFEPLAAFIGALITFFSPLQFLQVFSPAASSRDYSPLSQPIYDQLSAHLVRFAWSQAVTLRLTSELRVWKSVLFGMFLCDLVHLYSQYLILGPSVYCDPRQWRMEEWVNFVMLYGPGGLRVAACLGVGIREPGQGRERTNKDE